MAAPRRDTRGIVDAAELFARVDFRRREPAEPLRPYLEHYWLIVWDLTQPYASHVVPHPSVNVVFQRYAGQDPFGEVAGIGLDLFTQKLEGRGRVCGIQFRPGGFRPFAPDRPLSSLTGQRLRLPEVLPESGSAVAAVLDPDDERARVACGSGRGSRLRRKASRAATLAIALVDRIRADRAIRHVGEFAEAQGMTVRALQRLFSAYVGVGPKWIILRYRIHEALERAETAETVNWAALAADLGYADQAHLVRDFTATVGVPPTAYASGHQPS